MAELKISISELAELLSTNDFFKNFVSDFRMEGDFIAFNFQTGQFFPRYVPVSLLFKKFSDGQIIFEISTNWMSDQFLKLLPVKNSKYMKLKFPLLILYIENIEKSFLQGIHVKDIKFENGLYLIDFLIERE